MNTCCVNCGLDPHKIPNYRENAAPDSKQKSKDPSMRSFAQSKIVQFVVGLATIVLCLAVAIVLIRCIAAFRMWISVLVNEPCLEWFTAFMRGASTLVIIAGIFSGLAIYAGMIGKAVVNKFVR
jgi:ABC-type arginine transport system permease subunit